MATEPRNDAPMRAITVQPPWSDAIAWFGKNVENRKGEVAWRGEFYVHAGKTWNDWGAVDHRVIAAMRAQPEVERFIIGNRLSMEPEIARGAIVAKADLVDVHRQGLCCDHRCQPWGEVSYLDSRTGEMVAAVHFVMDDIVPVPLPVPCKGALTLGWPVPADVVEAVEAQLAVEVLDAR